MNLKVNDSVQIYLGGKALPGSLVVRHITGKVAKVTAKAVNIVTDESEKKGHSIWLPKKSLKLDEESEFITFFNLAKWLKFDRWQSYFVSQYQDIHC